MALYGGDAVVVAMVNVHCTVLVEDASEMLWNKNVNADGDFDEYVTEFNDKTVKSMTVILLLCIQMCDWNWNGCCLPNVISHLDLYVEISD